MEKATEGLLERWLNALAHLLGRRRATLDGRALRDIGLESYQPSLAQQMLDERRRHSVGLR
jgi:hypothetical protein